MPKQDRPYKALYKSKRWQVLRKAVFARDGYTCQMCGEACTGIGHMHPLSPECDHIEPHKGDLSLMWSMDNLQTLHKRCHSIKTATEDGGGHGGAQSHPDWLPKPKCPVELVCGPAGAGKTTYAQENATRRDVIIDLDDCYKIVCGVHGHHADRRHLTKAIRIRNKMLANLAGQPIGKAFVIVSAPTETEQQWWADKLGATVTLIKPTLEEILSRNIGHTREQLAKDWFTKAENGQWVRPVTKKMRQVGLDGYPI